MLAFKSTEPASPKPGAGFPRSASTAINRSPAPLNKRGAVSRSPGQYATPRLLTAAGAVYFQIIFELSGSSAIMSLPAVTYMIPLITSGVTCRPVTPVSNVHARCNVATFAGVICFSGEKRWPPAS